MKPKPTNRASDNANHPTGGKIKTITAQQFIHQAAANTLSEKWLDKQDVLLLMHISSSTLQKWRKKGLLPYSRVLGKIYYKESDLLKLLDEGKEFNRHA